MMQKSKVKHAKEIAIFQFYFYPDISAVSQLLMDLLSELSRSEKYSIHVICGTSTYTKEHSFEKKPNHIEKIRLKRLKTFDFGKTSFLTRILDYSLYYLSVYFYLLVSMKWDLIICITSPPPFIGFFVSMALLFRKTPFIYYIQDLYPEVYYDMGYLKRPWLIRKLMAFNRITLRRADRIVTIGDHMRRKILKSYGVMSNKILTITNWASGIEVLPFEHEDFTILYSGNMGLAHDFSHLKLLIRDLKSETGIRYRFIGGGKRKKEIIRIFSKEMEDRFTMDNYTEEDRVNENLGQADVLLISQKKETVGDILPSKFYSYLAAGRPILHLGPRNSEIGKLIVENDIGTVFESDSDRKNVLDYIIFLKKHPEIKRKIGSRARSIFENSFRLSHSAGKIRETIDGLIAESHA